jgi:hypothetical protein
MLTVPTWALEIAPRPAGQILHEVHAHMCCDGHHDVQARLDVPGHIRFVVMCASCGKVQREIGRQTYVPLPRLGSAPRGAER